MVDIFPILMWWCTVYLLSWVHIGEEISKYPDSLPDPLWLTYLLFWWADARFICGPESIIPKMYQNILTVCQILNRQHICHTEVVMHGSFVECRTHGFCVPIWPLFLGMFKFGNLSCDWCSPDHSIMWGKFQNEHCTYWGLTETCAKYIFVFDEMLKD